MKLFMNHPKSMFMFSTLQQWWVRYKYPVSLPEDVAKALGIEISNRLTFHEFIENLPRKSIKLQKFMPREEVEMAFRKAIKEPSGHRILFSYYFSEGWVVFEVHFDKQARLRRIYLKHKTIKGDHGIELSLR